MGNSSTLKMVGGLAFVIMILPPVYKHFEVSDEMANTVVAFLTGVVTNQLLHKVREQRKERAPKKDEDKAA